MNADNNYLININFYIIGYKYFRRWEILEYNYIYVSKKLHKLSHMLNKVVLDQKNIFK